MCSCINTVAGRALQVGLKLHRLKAKEAKLSLMLPPHRLYALAIKGQLTPIRASQIQDVWRKFSWLQANKRVSTGWPIEIEIWVQRCWLKSEIKQPTFWTFYLLYVLSLLFPVSDVLTKKSNYQCNDGCCRLQSKFNRDLFEWTTSRPDRTT